MLIDNQPKHSDWAPDVIHVDSSPKIQRALQSIKEILLQQKAPSYSL